MSEHLQGIQCLPCTHKAHACGQDNILQPLHLMRSQKQPFTILDKVSGVLKPGRFTLLLGPPSAGKSTLLKALAGRLHHSADLQVCCSCSWQMPTLCSGPCLLGPCSCAHSGCVHWTYSSGRRHGPCHQVASARACQSHFIVMVTEAVAITDNKSPLSTHLQHSLTVS